MRRVIASIRKWRWQCRQRASDRRKSEQFVCDGILSGVWLDDVALRVRLRRRCRLAKLGLRCLWAALTGHAEGQ